MPWNRFRQTCNLPFLIEAQVGCIACSQCIRECDPPMAPTISVLLPAFNSERHLEEAARSILDQTYRDLELVIIDDGSTDRTREIARALSQEDPRVQVVAHDQNRGLATRLNEGLSVARGEYIARMDADDVSLPHRLELQVGYLAAHPDIALVGGFIRLFGGKRSCVVRVATSPLHIKWRLLFGNSMGHVTVLGRRSFFSETGGYDETLKVAQDFDLWLRATRRFRLANIAEVLVEVREDPTSTSRRLSPERHSNAIEALNRVHGDLLSSPIPREITALCFSPSLLREDASLSDHIPEAMEVIERLTLICLHDPSSTATEARLIRSDARYKLAQLVLLRKGGKHWIPRNHGSPLLRSRDLPIAAGKHLMHRMEYLLGRC